MYIKIPIEIIKNYQLSSSSKILYGFLISLTKKDGYAYVSNTYLSKNLTISLRTVSRLLKELKEEHLVNIKIINGKRKIYLDKIFNSKC